MQVYVCVIDGPFPRQYDQTEYIQIPKVIRDHQDRGDYTHGVKGGRQDRNPTHRVHRPEVRHVKEE